MSKDDRKIKPVSFNKKDPHELALLNHAEKINPLTGKEQNFSKYVRRLIEEDMRREQQGGNNNVGGYNIIDKQNDENEDYTIEVKDAMNSFL